MTDPVAFVALALSAGTAGFTVYAWRRQNTLLEQQVAGEAADRVAQRAAEVRVTKGGASGVERFVEHEFHLVNAGPAVARELEYRVLDRSGADVVARQNLTLVLPEQSVRAVMQVPRPSPSPLTFVVSWSDGSGQHETRLECPLAHQGPSFRTEFGIELAGWRSC